MPPPPPQAGPGAGPTLPDRVRASCAAVTAGAELVRIDGDRLADYADELAPPTGGEEEEAAEVTDGVDAAAVAEEVAAPEVPAEWRTGDPDGRAGLVLTLATVNFGSGWHPLLAKAPGSSGARTVAAGVTRWWTAQGGLRPAQLCELDLAAVAEVVGQDPRGPARELLELFVVGLDDLGRWLEADHDGSWSAVLAAAGDSAAALAADLAWLPQWDDRAEHPAGGEVWLYKRAQLAAADVALAGLARFGDVDRLTLMADNLVPHVLRLDGVLRVDGELVERIERGELLDAGSPEEVELRAVAVTAVECLVAASAQRGRSTTAAELDRLLWWRGRLPRYKARPRHRARSTWY